MRWISFLSLLFCFLFYGGILAAPAVEVGRRDLNTVDTIAALDRRDDPASTTTAADNTSSEVPTATTTDKQSATTATATSSHTSASATSESTSVATYVPSLDGSTTRGQTSQNGSKSAYHGGLPIQPSITPAMAVAGAILLILGAALALIGIRKPRVYIFLSTALLAALGVTVLIEYVMTPPASNAVQGGYLVAVFFTGIVFGGLALVFQEITEGLSCLLGGFCIGMWFLTLKSGGLVTEQGSKIGFIIAFTAGFYCLSFSHYTRSYGSILCTSFAGSTTLVLGIDCFSRAGLKEFWLYIWGLNDDMFPLNTNTYPVTRNIRVEIAITIIIAVFGVIAQMRLWKVIKERRAKEESARLEEQRLKEETDVEAGRQLEEKNLKERAEWENIYGNRDDTKEPSLTETAVAEDSRGGSDGYGSPKRENGHSFEMKDMASPDQSLPRSDCGRTLDAVDEVESDSVYEEGHGPSHKAHQQDQPRDENNQETPRPITPVARKKSVPEIHVREDNDSEHGAVVGSEAGTLRSKRRSGTSFVNRLSWRSGHSKRNSESQEALVPDDTSSVAGIVDDLQSISSQRPSIASDHHDNFQPAHGQQAESKKLNEKDPVTETAKTGLGLRQNAEPVAKQEEANALKSHVQQDEQPVQGSANDSSLDCHKGKTTEDPITAPANDRDGLPKKAESLDSPEPANPRSTPSKDEPTETVPVPTTTEDPTPEATFLPKEAPAAAEAKDDTTEHSTKHQSQHQEVVPDNETIPESTVIEKKEIAKLDKSTVKSIPEQTSKVIHSFRTREWARHLADAETPDLEPLHFDIEPEADSIEKKEAAAPIDVDGLLQTALNAQPPPAVSTPVDIERSRPSSVQSRRQSRTSAVPSPEIPRSKMRHSMQSLLGARSSTPFSRNVSSPPLSPVEQNDPSVPLRSTSTPHLTITAPGETNEAKESPRWSGPPPLLAVRENMVRNRMSSTSLRYDPWAGRNQSRQSVVSADPIVSPPLSIPDEKDEEYEEVSRGDDDDVPLSKRRVMLQRQTMQSPSETSLHSSESARSPQYTTADAGRSASRMAAWRQSVREDLSQRRNSLAPHSPPPISPGPDRPRSLWGSVQQMRDASSTQVGNVVADGMQRGNMTDLHRQAMRKMQASANRKL